MIDENDDANEDNVEDEDEADDNYYKMKNYHEELDTGNLKIQ